MFSPFQCEGADFLVIAIQKSGLFHSKQDITSELNLKNKNLLKNANENMEINANYL